MQSRLSRMLVLAATLAVAACASAGSQESNSGYDRNRISQEEIQALSVNNALEVVQRLRPAWLRNRGADSMRSPSSLVVYVDDQPLGPVSSLSSFPISGIREMEYLDRHEATRRFGTNHAAGAIMVRTR